MLSAEICSMIMKSLFLLCDISFLWWHSSRFSSRFVSARLFLTFHWTEWVRKISLTCTTRRSRLPHLHSRSGVWYTSRGVSSRSWWSSSRSDNGSDKKLLSRSRARSHSQDSGLFHGRITGSAYPWSSCFLSSDFWCIHFSYREEAVLSVGPQSSSSSDGFISRRSRSSLSGSWRSVSSMVRKNILRSESSHLHWSWRFFIRCDIVPIVFHSSISGRSWASGSSKLLFRMSEVRSSSMLESPSSRWLSHFWSEENKMRKGKRVPRALFFVSCMGEIIEYFRIHAPLLFPRASRNPYGRTRKNLNSRTKEKRHL